MEAEIILAYDNNEEFKELFLGYTDLLIENHPDFAKYLELQNYESELKHLADKYRLPNQIPQ